MSTEPVIGSPTQAEMRAVTGPKAEYYLQKWHLREHNGFNSFNWAAALLYGVWLPYRKMYRVAFILYAAIIFESVLERLLFVGWLDLPETPRSLDSAVFVAVGWLCGSFGNRWYRAYVGRVVADARASTPIEEERLALLSRRGGTSVLAAIGLFAAFTVALVLTMLGVDWLAGRA